MKLTVLRFYRTKETGRGGEKFVGREGGGRSSKRTFMELDFFSQSLFLTFKVLRGGNKLGVRTEIR